MLKHFIFNGYKCVYRNSTNIHKNKLSTLKILYFQWFEYCHYFCVYRNSKIYTKIVLVMSSTHAINRHKKAEILIFQRFYDIIVLADSFDIGSLTAGTDTGSAFFLSEYIGMRCGSCLLWLSLLSGSRSANCL